MLKPFNSKTPGLSRSAAVLFALTGVFALIGTVVGEDHPAGSSTPIAYSGPTSRPLFEELNRESQTLFKQIAGSVVRVQLPVDEVGYGPGDPLSKWSGQVNDSIRRRLAEIQRRAPENGYVVAEIGPTSAPSTTEPAATEPDTQHLILLQLRHFAPNGIGVIVDNDDHVLIPRYVAKEAFVGPVPIELGDGRTAMATFVGSDRMADATVLKLQSHAKPATMSAGRPDPGSLLLVLSLNPALNRLAVWEGWEPDFAALVTIDGQLAGFTKSGHFICASTYQSVVRELIDYGRVRRPFMGVLIEPVLPEDPQRQANPALGETAALRIREVIPHYAAEAAGLKAGDLILELAGEAVPDAHTFAAAIANRRGKTDMVILRNSSRITVTVDLQVQ